MSTVRSVRYCLSAGSEQVGLGVRQKVRQKIAGIAHELPSDEQRTVRAWDEAPANAHDLPSRVARPRGFEPLTFGSVAGRPSFLGNPMAIEKRLHRHDFPR
jgi:hypothetical protein